MSDSCEHVEPAEALGITPVKIINSYVGITLNYAPTYVFPVMINTRKKRCSWGALTPYQQRDIFIEHLKTIYLKHFDEITYTFELTKEGQLHCHAMGLMYDINPDHAEFDLTVIRKAICQSSEVIRYTKGHYRKIVYSNYIHYVEKDQWHLYITKELNKTPFNITTITPYARVDEVNEKR